MKCKTKPASTCIQYIFPVCITVGSRCPLSPAGGAGETLTPHARWSNKNSPSRIFGWGFAKYSRDFINK
jgi:hypothetical protein